MPTPGLRSGQAAGCPAGGGALRSNRRHLVLGAALAAITPMVAAAAWAARQDVQDEAAGIVAAQLRRQGFACTAPRDAVLHPGSSLPNETVWTLRCNESAYSVRLLPHLGARVTPFSATSHAD